MGGVNHQPCGRYLKNSTKLSRAMSSAKLHLEQANVVLEDVLLFELGGSSLKLDPMVASLQMSSASLRDAIETCSDLRMQMTEEGYEDLPPFRRLNLAGIGEEMAADGLVDMAAWRDVQSWGASVGFYAVLDKIEAHFEHLLELTQALTKKSQGLMANQPVTGIAAALEQNLPMNIKFEFAELYAKWHWFQARFLASSMLSTEVWYAFNGYGSLVQRSCLRQAVA